MLPSIRHLLAVIVLTMPVLVAAQTPVIAAPDQERLLADPDPKLAANKRLVYDFWREVFEGGQMGSADRYLAENYIQHNPNVPNGRAPFVAFRSKFAPPIPVEAKIKAPMVAIVADGDLVVFAFARSYPDPRDPEKRYTTSWFDMFRIEDGKIAEHWDPAQKQ